MNSIFIPHHQPSVISDPREGSFHFPSSPVTTKRPTILQFFLYPIRAVWRNQFNSTLLKSCSKFRRICSFVINKPLNSFHLIILTSLGNVRFIKCIFNQGDFRRGRRVQVVPQRNSLAACHHHPLRTHSTFGLSDAEPPFLAEAKLPSANVSDQSNCPFSSSSDRNALQAISHASLSSHSCKRLQHVEGEGYCSGKSFQRAPLRRTHRIPSKQRRLETRRRPFICSGSIRNGAIISHCLSVNSLFNLFAGRESSFVIADSPLINLYL